MTSYVIDTSALVRFVIPEEYDDYIERIVLLHRESEIQLIAPDFLLVECANVLWKYARRMNVSVEDIITAHDDLRRINVRLVRQDDLLDDALRLAVDIGVTVYDALYCALARREDVEIITEDRRLRNALD